MCEIDTTSIWKTLASLWCLIQGALAFDPAVFQTVQGNPAARSLTLFILLIAGISVELGQSVVLFLNKVRPGRFVISLVAGGIFFILSAFIWTGTIWLIATYGFHTQAPFADVFRTVSLGYAPAVFGVLILLPFLGNPIHRVLYVWTLLAIITGVMVTFQFSFWQALTCSLLGWIMIEVLTHFFDKPLHALDNWSWRIITGAATHLRVEDLAPRPASDTDEAATTRRGKS